MNGYPYPNPPPVAPIDAHAADAAIEQTRFDQDAGRCAEIVRFGQEALSVQIRHQFIKAITCWLTAYLLEQPEIFTVKDPCIFGRKQLSILYIYETDD